MAWPIVAAVGGQLVNTFIGNRAERKANQERRNQAQIERNWNERMWRQQNEYNHPAAQMERLKDAGLNPRLLYGASSGQAAGNAGDVKGFSQPDIKSEWTGTRAFDNIVQYRNLEAQTDNVKAMTEVNAQEAANKAQDLLNKQLDNEVKGFDYGISKELRQANIDAARANAESAMSNALKNRSEADVSAGTKDARIKLAEIEAEVGAKTKDWRIEQADINVKKALQDLEGYQLENRLKQLSIELKEQGIEQSDHVIFRLLARHLDDIPEFMESLKLPSKKGSNTTFKSHTFPNPNKF